MNIREFEEYIKIHLISLEQDSEELQKQMGFYDDLDSDVSIPLIDVMHGWLKVEMLGAEDELKDNPDRFLEGYLQALTNCYAMTYNLSIDRMNIEKRYYE